MQLKQMDLLQVDVGTDQGVVEEEDLSLLRLENLTFITINNFRQQFTLTQLPLLRVQQLETQSSSLIETLSTPSI